MQDPAKVSDKIDELVSQLVIANLDKEILQHKLLHKEQQFHEVSKPIELLKKLVMLLEMEKEVAMEEKTNLGYKGCIYSLQASRNSEPVYDKVSAGCIGLDKHNTKNKENKTEEKTGFKWLKKLNNINLFTKCSLNPYATPCCTFSLHN
ncbi:hypothetical protein F2Q69_00003679 [Brassica cretica]|uniref:Uncharacterized protein n=1 Tax=Brassica cretica TaxID=69181 RepID=A0A8S9NRA8_BRACR|nr:hypothetical protein F2Q69_00003679 [Brassica cretica]